MRKDNNPLSKQQELAEQGKDRLEHPLAHSKLPKMDLVSLEDKVPLSKSQLKSTINAFRNQDSSPSIRIFWGRVLLQGSFDKSLVQEAFLEVLEGSSSQMREFAAESFERCGCKHVETRLLALVDLERVPERSYLIRALASSDPNKYKQLLLSTLDEKHIGAALAALQMLTPEMVNEAKDFKQVINAANHSDQSLQIEALKLMSRHPLLRDEFVRIVAEVLNSEAPVLLRLMSLDLLKDSDPLEDALYEALLRARTKVLPFLQGSDSNSKQVLFLKEQEILRIIDDILTQAVLRTDPQYFRILTQAPVLITEGGLSTVDRFFSDMAHSGADFCKNSTFQKLGASRYQDTLLNLLSNSPNQEHYKHLALTVFMEQEVAEPILLQAVKACRGDVLCQAVELLSEHLSEASKQILVELYLSSKSREDPIAVLASALGRAQLNDQELHLVVKHTLDLGAHGMLVSAFAANIKKRQDFDIFTFEKTSEMLLYAVTKDPKSLRGFEAKRILLAGTTDSNALKAVANFLFESIHDQELIETYKKEKSGWVRDPRNLWAHHELILSGYRRIFSTERYWTKSFDEKQEGLGNYYQIADFVTQLGLESEPLIKSLAKQLKDRAFGTPSWKDCFNTVLQVGGISTYQLVIKLLSSPPANSDQSLKDKWPAPLLMKILALPKLESTELHGWHGIDFDKRGRDVVRELHSLLVQNVVSHPNEEVRELSAIWFGSIGDIGNDHSRLYPAASELRKLTSLFLKDSNNRYRALQAIPAWLLFIDTSDGSDRSLAASETQLIWKKLRKIAADPSESSNLRRLTWAKILKGTSDEFFATLPIDPQDKAPGLVRFLNTFPVQELLDVVGKDEDSSLRKLIIDSLVKEWPVILKEYSVLDSMPLVYQPILDGITKRVLSDKSSDHEEIIKLHTALCDNIEGCLL